MIEIISDSWKHTFNIGKQIGQNVMPGDIICLMGDLGTGKTILVKGIAKGMNIEDNVNSPSYTLINEYHGSIDLYHFDVYRLDNVQDVYDIGIEEYLFGDGVTVIEWADKIPELLMQDRLEIYINKIDIKDNYRKISIKGIGDRFKRMERRLKQSEGTSIR